MTNKTPEYDTCLQWDFICGAGVFTASSRVYDNVRYEYEAMPDGVHVQQWAMFDYTDENGDYQTDNVTIEKAVFENSNIAVLWAERMEAKANIEKGEEIMSSGRARLLELPEVF